MSIFELLGLSLVLPLFYTLLGDGIIENNFILNLNILIEEFIGTANLSLFLITIVAFLFITKNIYSIFIIRLQNNFFKDIEVDIAKKLLTVYLNQNIIFHKNNNSSILIKKINTDVQFLSTLFSSFFKFFSDLILLSAFIIIIIIYNYSVAIYLLLFFILFFFLYYKLYKKKIRVWSIERNFINSEAYKSLTESLSSYKEIVLYQAKNFFIKNYNNKLTLSCNLRKNFDNIQSYPRIFLEILFLLIFLFSFIFLNMRGHENREIIVILSFFFIATLRLAPSFISIFKYFQLRKFSKVTLKEILKDLSLNSQNLESDYFNSHFLFKKNIRFLNVSYRYKNRNIILKKCSFNIKKNEFIGIVGSSGSGKTTLIELVIGLLKPSSGKILVDNLELKSGSVYWENIIGYVSQDSIIIDDTILKNVGFGKDSNEINKRKVFKLLDSVNLTFPKKFILNEKLGERGSKLSEGQKQRLLLARALYKDPQILILDEVTSSLDSKNERLIINEINKLKKNKTILLISHKKSSLIYCSRIFNLEYGKINENKK
jgi:ABC-type multidrug transport system fused ATPase/permease subunit